MGLITKNSGSDLWQNLKNCVMSAIIQYVCQGNNYQENVMLLRLYTMCHYYIKNDELLLQQSFESFNVQLFNSWFSRDVRKN